MARMGKGDKCTCNPAWMILSAVLIAVGIFLGVQGFATQLSGQFQASVQGGAWDTSALGWIVGYYFVGVILIGVGKILKWKGTCSVHAMHKM